MKVLIPTPLLDYTAGHNAVDADGDTLAALFVDLDQHFPGLRFRVIDEQDTLRCHMRVFVNGEGVRDLNTALSATDEVMIVQALSGG